MTALAIQVRENSKVEKDGGEEGGKPKKKKRKQEQVALSEKVARANGVREEGAEFKKRKKKGKPIKREDSQINLDSRSPILASPLPSTSPPALTADTARRLTLSELAHHRKFPVADLAELPPSLNPDTEFPSLLQPDILVDPHPSASFPHSDDDGELTDEEEFDDNPFILHFDDSTGEVEYHDSEMIDIVDSPTPHPLLPPDSALSFIAASQLPSLTPSTPTNSTSLFPTSYTRVEDSSIDPVLRRLSFPSQPNLTASPFPTPPSSQPTNAPSIPITSPYFPIPQLQSTPQKEAQSESLASKMLEKFSILAGKKNEEDSKSFAIEGLVGAGSDVDGVAVTEQAKDEEVREEGSKGEKVE